jgi:hypothetical protein
MTAYSGDDGGELGGHVYHSLSSKLHMIWSHANMELD